MNIDSHDVFLYKKFFNHSLGNSMAFQYPLQLAKIWYDRMTLSIPSLASLLATVAAPDLHLVLTRATFRQCFVDGSGNIGFPQPALVECKDGNTPVT